MTTPLLEIRGLTLQLPVDGGLRPVLRGIDLAVAPGECVGVVGESGSGKSMTARSVIRVLPPGARLGGTIKLAGTDVTEMSGRELRAVRARRVAMVFQDPRAHIDPVRTIGDHLTEGIRLLDGQGRREARTEAESLLDAVRLDDPARLLGRYPHELSGGMLQRVMIAAALAGKPDLLLADEPTTALDVTTQAEVTAILADLRTERHLGVVFISHDLELAAAISDRIAVMYAGEIVEDSPAADLYRAPLHPYAIGLLESRPTLTGEVGPLAVIPGRPISAFEVEAGCPFAPRCRYADEPCETVAPVRRRIGEGVACCHHSERVRADVVRAEAAP